MTEYRGMNLAISPFDNEHKGYFEAAREHRLVVQRCDSCNLLRWEPGTACPWCQSMQWGWQQVSGKGTIYSYQIVHQAIQPGFRDWAPYPIVLVELDEQRATPTADEALRLIMNLVDADFNAEAESNVAIGKRVEIVFLDIDADFTLPQWRLSAEQPNEGLWQFPG
ncbi:MAG: Zn-ribbon domain-containing OB-fold protein [Dehalococcoidia bacterium]